jgi:hypothetical protein
MLGQIYEKAERNDYAGKYYARIVREYPLSPLVADAKQKLQKFGVPVPQPDPTAVARMQKEQETRHGPGLVARSMGIFRTRPDVSMAAAAGDPTMTPASETGDETLSLGPPPTLAAGGGSGRGSSATVETVTPGSTAALAQPSADSTATSSPSSSNSADPSTSQTSSDPAAAQAAQSGTTAPPADKSQESTSKKKKGLHKIIPW